MKKLLVLVIVATTCLSAFCQKGYSDFDSVANVLIKTKIAHANSKDDSSPLELSLYFQNNGNADVIVRYQIFIEDNNGEKRHSGKKEVKLKHGQKQFGKISGPHTNFLAPALTHTQAEKENGILQYWK